MQTLDFIIDVFFPKHCLGCHKDGAYLCQDCFELIPINNNLIFEHQQYSNLNGLWVASDSDNPLLHQMIYKFKYNFVFELSAALGKILIKFLENYSPMLQLPKQNLVIIPVPLSKRRMRWRGFNQAEILAKELEKHFHIPVNSDILKRPHHGRPQMEIKNALTRRQSIKGAFKLSPLWKGNLKNNIIILIDDIATTTATLQECAKILKPLKPKNIFGLVLCRG